MGNTCYINFAIISLALVQSSCYSLYAYVRLFYWAFVALPTNCLPSAHVQIRVWNKFLLLNLNFITPGLPCDKPCVETGIHLLKDCMNPGTGCKPYKSLHYWAQNITEQYSISILWAQLGPTLIPWAELHPDLKLYRSLLYLNTLPSSSLP